MTLSKLAVLSAEYCKAVYAHDAAKQRAEDYQRRATVARAIEIQKDLMELKLAKALRAAKRALRAEGKLMA